MPKKNSMGYAKTRKKRKMSMPKGMREKNIHAKEQEEKKRERNKQTKIAHTFK